VLVELETLTGADAPPTWRVRALARSPVGSAPPIADWRSRCGASARALSVAPRCAAEALASLEEAARLDPAHPLVAADGCSSSRRSRAPRRRCAWRRS
jgi:hypothetical protein